MVVKTRNQKIKQKNLIKKENNSSNSSKGVSNSRQPPCSRYWCFTLNNYTENDIEKINSSNSSKIWRFVFQEETGEAGEIEDNEGTPHLQGFIDFGKGKKARPLNYFKELLGHGRIHWSKTRNVKASIAYCQKKYTRTGETFRRGISEPFEILIELFPWQTKIMKILESEPDERAIHYVIGSDGLEGKTTFGKWLFLKYDDIIVISGKASDMKNCIIDFMKKNEGEAPKKVIINIPRSTNPTFISWTGIEEIKDMFFYSGKYEGGMVCAKCPHVVIFANHPPEMSKLSGDRWNIIKIATESDANASDILDKGEPKKNSERELVFN